MSFCCGCSCGGTATTETHLPSLSLALPFFSFSSLLSKGKREKKAEEAGENLSSEGRPTSLFYQKGKLEVRVPSLSYRVEQYFLGRVYVGRLQITKSSRKICVFKSCHYFFATPVFYLSNRWTIESVTYLKATERGGCGESLICQAGFNVSVSMTADLTVDA